MDLGVLRGPRGLRRARAGHRVQRGKYQGKPDSQPWPCAGAAERGGGSLETGDRYELGGEHQDRQLAQPRAQTNSQ